jgi:hypothetical protein
LGPRLGGQAIHRQGHRTGARRRSFLGINFLPQA